MRALLVVVARSAALSLGVLSASAVAAWVDAEPPANYPLTWGGEPEVVLSSTRSEIVLNGLWRFLPASGPAAQAPTETGWGYIPVPGSWRDRNPWYAYIPLNVTRGKGPMWEKLTDQNRAWYQRSFVVPGGWAGRAVLLNLERVSTDAKVWVNGTECGSVAWPAGSVEITRAVRFGTTNALQLLVVAAEETGAVFEFMETAVSQVTAKEATLDSKGLIGDVTVSSRPPGAHVSDLFVQTSTRRQELTVNVELNGLARPGRVQLTARLLRAMDAAGNETEPLEEVRFAATCDVTAAATQTVQAAWSWPKPRLWDVGQPNLYTLLLEVRDDSTGFHDERAQRFGFREFWIEGRDFCLNGTRINLRPTVNEPGMGIAEVTDAGIDGLMACGFNFTELWPRDLYFRGTPHTRQMFLDRADRKGYLVAGNVASMNMSILDGKWKFAWNVPGVQEAWKQRVDSDLRLNRNHPSLIMWSTSPNFFGHAADQDPRFIGTRNYGRDDASWLQRAEAGREGVASIKASDPTRPVFTHQGAWVGDVHTVNMYLCLLPLQEREEWLSDYVKQGVMPLLPIEFGTPLHSTFMRGRRGFGDAGSSEPWMTEFCAIYMGPQAYAMEQPVYRKEIVARFVKDQEYLRWHANEPMEGAPAYQALQVLYIRNTWRSWRTWGLSGGMVPWIGDMRRWGPDTVGAAAPINPRFRSTTCATPPASISWILPKHLLPTTSRRWPGLPAAPRPSPTRAITSARGRRWSNRSR
jgi:beta-galactosidase